MLISSDKTVPISVEKWEDSFSIHIPKSTWESIYTLTPFPMYD